MNYSALRRLAQAGINIGWFAAGLYGLITTLMLLLKVVVNNTWLPVEAFSNFLPLWLLPALILLPLGLLRRHWRLSVSFVTAVLAFVIWYGGSFLPHSVPTATAASSLHLMTYNLHGEAVNIEPMLTVIRDSGSDLIALQELSPEMANAIDAELNQLYPYRALHPNFDNPIWGQGVLSRYPISADEYWHISLGHQRVVIGVGQVPITLYNTHPIHPFRVRDGQWFDMQMHQKEVDVILERVKRDHGAVIVAGDFNMSDQSSDYQRLRGYFKDAYRESGWGLGFTFPDLAYSNALPVDVPLLSAVVRPVARLDFIFYNESLESMSARVGATSGGSDHRPVLAELVLK